MNGHGRAEAPPPVLGPRSEPAPPAPEPLDEDAFAASHAQPTVPAAELERLGRRVIGVFACRILRRGREVLPHRVRVVAHGSRRSAVAKDIQSAWYAAFALYVPRARFVVTAVRSRFDLLPERRRLQLCQLKVTSAGGVASVSVSLHWAGQVFEGAVIAPAAPGLPPVAAQAAVDAVREAIGPSPGLALADVRTIRVAGGTALVAAVAADGRTLLGVCADRGDRMESAARAVLDATNRLVATGRTAEPSALGGPGPVPTGGRPGTDPSRRVTL